MPWCPFALHKPLTENDWQGGIEPRAIVLHTAVTGADSLFGWFEHGSNLESHFYVRDDGVIEQYMDTMIRADANRKANGFAVSIETWDNQQVIPWTHAQVEAIIRLCDWLCTTHPGIKRELIPHAFGSGIGYHVMFGAPGPWTPSVKSCPGPPRIAQVPFIIEKVALMGRPKTPTPDPEENAVSYAFEMPAGAHTEPIPLDPAHAHEIVVAPNDAVVHVRDFWNWSPKPGKGTGGNPGGFDIDVKEGAVIPIPRGTSKCDFSYTSAQRFRVLVVRV